jgi:hypothetical protein
LLHARADVAALADFREATGLFRLSFGNFPADALDHPRLVQIHPGLEFAIQFRNFSKLPLCQSRTLLRDRTLLFKIQKMPAIRSQRFGEVHGDGALDHVALAGKVCRETSRHRCRNANKLRIDERGRCNAIGDVRKESPRAYPDQCNCENQPGTPAANQALDGGGKRSHDWILCFCE